MLLKLLQPVSRQPKRQLWGWLNTIFNRVDASRVQDVGPDRACAEWLLRCGAGVKWVNDKDFLRDYNSLPAGDVRSRKIEEIDATGSAIMHVGFPHLNGLKHVNKIVFHKCGYLEDSALSYLHYVSESLRYLEVSSCGNITQDGLRHLGKLKKLEYLHLYDLPAIESKEASVNELKKLLPGCTVDFPYAHAGEREERKIREDERKGKK